MVSLDVLENWGEAPSRGGQGANGKGEVYEAAGYVAPVFVNEEDAGQEDEEDKEIMQRLRTSRILKYSFDFTISDE